MKKLKKAKPGMPRDWIKIERTARRLSSISSVYVNDINGKVAAIIKSGATKEAIKSEFNKSMPPESLIILNKVTDTLKEIGWRKLWPRSNKNRVA